MILRINDIKRVLFFLMFFLLGIGYVYHVLVCCVLYFLLLLYRPVKLLISNRFLYYEFWLLFFIISYYVLSLSNGFYVYSIERQMLLMFVIVVLCPLIYFEANRNDFFIISGYVMALFFDAIYVVGYNYMINPFFAHGNLINPYNMQFINSPAYSNNLIIVFCFSLLIYYNYSEKIIKVLSLFVLLTSVSIAIYLGGRAFFLITFIFVLLAFINGLNFKIFFKTGYVLILGVLFFVIFNDYIYEPLLKFYDRLHKYDYYNSGRYEYWVYALKNIPAYPLGGIDIVNDFGGVYWFHNLWFDVAKVSGWMPLIVLMGVNIDSILMWSYMKKRSHYDYLLWLCSFVCLIIMFQDVVLEGNYKVFVAYILINTALLSKMLYNIRRS